MGWSSRLFIDELTPHLLKGRAVELVYSPLEFKGFDIALRLAPLNNTLQGRTLTMEALVYVGLF